MQTMTLNNTRKKYLRTLGHKLDPVVTVAGKGLTEAVLAEIDRALNDHELIKVKLAVGDRDVKKVVIEEICAKMHADQVQVIGHILLLHRAAKKPDPKLSNLLR
jgi:RNA-binding protein